MINPPTLNEYTFHPDYTDIAIEDGIDNWSLRTRLSQYFNWDSRALTTGTVYGSQRLPIRLRFECKTDKSSKFWEIVANWDVTGRQGTITTSWGRIGTANPQSTVKTVNRAYSFPDKIGGLIRNKLDKGYKKTALITLPVVPELTAEEKQQRAIASRLRIL